MTEDDAISAALAAELQRHYPLDLCLRPLTVLSLTGLLQLVLRHPQVNGDVRTVAVQFVETAREYFADCPTVLDVIRRGDDPTQDR